MRFAGCGGGSALPRRLREWWLRAALAIPLRIPAAYDREGIHNVVDGGARRGKWAVSSGELLGALVVGQPTDRRAQKPATPIIGRYRWKQAASSSQRSK